MWMNLHTLPVGKSMYTVYLTWDPEGTPRSETNTEEIDLILGSRVTADEIKASPELKAELENYLVGARVIGITNESDGYVMYDGLA